MARIVGIDPDTRQISAVLLEDGKPPVIWQWAVKGNRAEDRFARLCEEFSVGTSFDAGFPAVDWVYIEIPIMGVNVKALRDQAQIVGMIRGRLLYLHVPHSLVDNGTWKRLTVGTGHATKEEIKAWALMVEPSLPTGAAQDVYDAFCIAKFGQSAARGEASASRQE